MSARIHIDVKWRASEKLWTIRRRDISGGVLAYERKKADAIKCGRVEARALEANGENVELVVWRQDGAIGKGRGSKSSYGGDPRRSRG